MFYHVQQNVCAFVSNIILLLKNTFTVSLKIKDYFGLRTKMAVLTVVNKIMPITNISWNQYDSVKKNKIIQLSTLFYNFLFIGKVIWVDMSYFLKNFVDIG